MNNGRGNIQHENLIGFMMLVKSIVHIEVKIMVDIKISLILLQEITKIDNE